VTDHDGGVLQVSAIVLRARVIHSFVVGLQPDLSRISVRERKVRGMDVIVDRVAGLDVHKDTVVAAVRTAGGGRSKRDTQVRTFGTFQSQLESLADWLIECGVTHVAMEATGVFWKPVWHVLDERGFVELVLANPGHIKNVPGRKTDVNDATWIAQLLECGLLRASFVPPVEIRELRDVTRYRRQLSEERARETQRLQKILEDANVKLSSVASDTLGVTGRLILEALCRGERDPDVLAGMAKRRLKAKTEELRLSVPGRFNAHHARMVRELLDHIDYLANAIERLNVQIDEMMIPFTPARDRLDTIPGIAKRTAEIVIAEIGVDMTRFASSAHLASWAGLCPGNNESAGKHKATTTRSGNPWLTSALVEAAWSAVRTKDCYLGVKFWKIAKRRGQQRAIIAIAHTLVEICWHLLNTDTTYNEIGPDYLNDKDHPDRRKKHLVHQLEHLGYTVELQKTA
jgi:transposase